MLRSVCPASAQRQHHRRETLQSEAAQCFPSACMHSLDVSPGGASPMGISPTACVVSTPCVGRSRLHRCGFCGVMETVRMGFGGCCGLGRVASGGDSRVGVCVRAECCAPSGGAWSNRCDDASPFKPPRHTRSADHGRRGSGRHCAGALAGRRDRAWGRRPAWRGTHPCRRCRAPPAGRARAGRGSG